MKKKTDMGTQVYASAFVCVMKNERERGGEREVERERERVFERLIYAYVSRRMEKFIGKIESHISN